MDGDGRFGPVCEAIVNGRYFWLPFSAIARDAVSGACQRHRSGLAPYALVRLTDGSEQVCQIPARYPLLAGG